MTKGYLRVEDEVLARIRRGHLMARTAERDDDVERRASEVIAAALLLAWVVGASASASWVRGKGVRAASDSVPATLSKAIERLRQNDLTVGWIDEVAESVQPAGRELARQVVARGIDTMDGFPPDVVRKAVETVVTASRKPPEPIVADAVDRVRSHAKACERIVQQATYAAFNDAIAAVAVQPAAVKKFPLWRIDETMDEVTRGNPGGEYPEPHRHWQFSGYVNTMEEIVRQNVVPPNGWNCRAALVPVNVEDAKLAKLLLPNGDPDPVAIRAANGARQNLIDEAVYPDLGFIKATS